MDCEKSPNCSSLNRNPCYLSSNVCGSCRIGYYGDIGDSNSLCYQNVVDSIQSKSCMNSCSSNGQCIFMNVNTNTAVSTCTTIDPSCEARCICFSGYASGDCSLTLDEINRKQILRERLVDRLAGLISADDSNLENSLTWTSILSTLVYKTDELSSAAVHSVHSIVRTFF